MAQVDTEVASIGEWFMSKKLEQRLTCLPICLLDIFHTGPQDQYSVHKNRLMIIHQHNCLCQIKHWMLLSHPCILNHFNYLSASPIYIWDPNFISSICLKWCVCSGFASFWLLMMSKALLWTGGIIENDHKTFVNSYITFSGKYINQKDFIFEQVGHHLSCHCIWKIYP